MPEAAHSTRLGDFAAKVAGRKTKWIVIAIWVALVVASGPVQGLLEERSTNSSSNFLPAAADSTKVNELLTSADTFASGEQVPAIVIFQSKDGEKPLTPVEKAAVEDWLGALEEDLGSLPADPQLISPFAAQGPAADALKSEDGSTLLTFVNLTSPDSEQLSEVVKELRKKSEDLPSSLDVYVSGPAAFASDASDAFLGIDGRLLIGTSILVLVLLLLIYRSPLVALVPLIAVIMAASLSRAALGLAIDPLNLTVSGQTSGIMLILIFGAGTDYCLLIVARFREELQRFQDPHDAMRETVRHTTPAILSSAGTVILAMFVLLLADLRSTSSLGPALILGVTIAMLAGLTLLPAMLLALGRRSFWPFVPRFNEELAGKQDAVASADAPAPRGVWGRLAWSIHRRPVAWLIPVTLALFIAAGGIFTANNQPTSDLDLFLDKPESTQGIAALSRKLPAGELAQGTILVGGPNEEQVKAATGAVVKEATASDAVGLSFPGEAGKKGDTYWQQVTFSMEGNPYSQVAVDAIKPLRQDLNEAVEDLPNSDDILVLVGGPTAQTLDTQTTNRRDLRLIVPGVLLVIALVLIWLLRALVAPVFLVGTVVLGFFATIGICYVLFLGILDQPGIDPGTLTFIFLFTAALGVDYNIFLVARIREEVLRLGNTALATRHALAVTGGVITSAGVILAGTFLILAALPLLPLRQLGIAVAIGVLLDTILVRAIMVPAVLTILGERSWWPNKIARPRS